MGYTHYFQQQKKIEPDAWEKICDDAQKIIDYCKKDGIPLTTDDTGKPIIQRKRGIINMNGVDEDSHETFYIKRSLYKDFNFCKTARKPYDLAVTAILMVIEHHSPNTFNTGSDGEVADWEAAANLNFNLFRYGFRVPPRLEQDEPEAAANLEKYFVERLISEEHSHLEEVVPKSDRPASRPKV